MQSDKELQLNEELKSRIEKHFKELSLLQFIKEIDFEGDKYVVLNITAQHTSQFKNIFRFFDNGKFSMERMANTVIIHFFT